MRIQTQNKGNTKLERCEQALYWARQYIGIAIGLSDDDQNFVAALDEMYPELGRRARKKGYSMAPDTCREGTESGARVGYQSTIEQENLP